MGLPLYSCLEGSYNPGTNFHDQQVVDALGNWLRKWVESSFLPQHPKVLPISVLSVS